MQKQFLWSEKCFEMWYPVVDENNIIYMIIVAKTISACGAYGPQAIKLFKQIGEKT